MIYRELKVYETPLGLKKTVRADLCERAIYGHTVFRVDLLPDIFKHISLLTRAPELDTNYPRIREDLVTALGGDCSDAQYAGALARIYDGSPFFEAYFNYHFIMRRNAVDLSDLVIPLVGCVKSAGAAVLASAGGTYMAEDSGYLYILDAYAPALQGRAFAEIR